jgi:hypothetical protein
MISGIMGVNSGSQHLIMCRLTDDGRSRGPSPTAPLFPPLDYHCTLSLKIKAAKAKIHLKSQTNDSFVTVTAATTVLFPSNKRILRCYCWSGD